MQEPRIKISKPLALEIIECANSIENFLLPLYASDESPDADSIFDLFQALKFEISKIEENIGAYKSLFLNALNFLGQQKDDIDACLTAIKKIYLQLFPEASEHIDQASNENNNNIQPSPDTSSFSEQFDKIAHSLIGLNFQNQNLPQTFAKHKKKLRDNPNEWAGVFKLFLNNLLSENAPPDKSIYSQIDQLFKLLNVQPHAQPAIAEANSRETAKKLLNSFNDPDNLLSKIMWPVFNKAISMMLPHMSDNNQKKVKKYIQHYQNYYSSIENNEKNSIKEFLRIETAEIINLVFEIEAQFKQGKLVPSEEELLFQNLYNILQQMMRLDFYSDFTSSFIKIISQDSLSLHHPYFRENIPEIYQLAVANQHRDLAEICSKLFPDLCQSRSRAFQKNPLLNLTLLSNLLTEDDIYKDYLECFNLALTDTPTNLEHILFSESIPAIYRLAQKHSHKEVITHCETIFPHFVTPSISAPENKTRQMFPELPASDEDISLSVLLDSYKLSFIDPKKWDIFEKHRSKLIQSDGMVNFLIDREENDLPDIPIFLELLLSFDQDLLEAHHIPTNPQSLLINYFIKYLKILAEEKSNPSNNPHRELSNAKELLIEAARLREDSLVGLLIKLDPTVVNYAFYDPNTKENISALSIALRQNNLDLAYFIAKNGSFENRLDGATAPEGPNFFWYVAKDSLAKMKVLAGAGINTQSFIDRYGVTYNYFNYTANLIFMAIIKNQTKLSPHLHRLNHFLIYGCPDDPQTFTHINTIYHSNYLTSRRHGTTPQQLLIRDIEKTIDHCCKARGPLNIQDLEVLRNALQNIRSPLHLALNFNRKNSDKVNELIFKLNGIIYNEPVSTKPKWRLPPDSPTPTVEEVAEQDYRETNGNSMNN